MTIGAALAKRSTLGLRTKFLCSLVLTTAGLSCVTLLAVRHAAQKHLQQEIVMEAQNSSLTLQVLMQQREAALSHKANLLATLASVTVDNDPTLQDSADNPLDNEDSDLVILANGDNNIRALHAMNSRLSPIDARALLSHSKKEGLTSDWWYTGGALYQVVLRPVENREVAEGGRLGTVVVGREVGYSAIHDQARISSSEVAFTYGGEIVESTLTPLDQYELAAKMQDNPGLEHIQIANHEFYGISLPLTNDASPAAHIIVLKSYTASLEFLRELNQMLIGLGILALITATWLAVFISDTFTRPLARLDKGVQALERGDFKFPLDASGGDEVARVTRAFDHMRGTLQKNEAQKQHLEEELRQSQKMDALGRLAGGVAHDFNNLLTVIKGHSDLMLERLQPGSTLMSSGEQIRKAAERAASLTRQMLAFSRRQTLEPTVFDVNVLVSDMCKLLKRLIHEDIEFSLRAGASLAKVKADTGQIEQVVLNLAVNACDAMPHGGKLTIETKNVAVDEAYTSTHSTIPPGNYTVLSVTDTGVGMDAETKARIFEPFFTTKAKGKGTGLGLATVYGVVKQSGGFIWVETAPGRGSRFEVYLPQTTEATRAARREEAEIKGAHAAETILLAEDEEAVRELTCQFLAAAGYRVFVAEDGEKALKIAETLSQPIHLLVTDVVMPKMRGTELAKRLRDLQPNMKVIYMSGYLGEQGDTEEFVENSQYLQKPFTRDNLLQRASVALAHESAGRPQLQIA
jgi:signal transduction histidine kinase/ActR/RegA family two-component response regulator